MDAHLAEPPDDEPPFETNVVSFASSATIPSMLCRR
jgi:hypothetical protein